MELACPVCLVVCYVPEVDHDMSFCGGDLCRGPVDRFSVHIPGDGVLLPVEGVFVEVLRGIEAQIVDIFMVACAVGVVIELNLCGIDLRNIY